MGGLLLPPRVASVDLLRRNLAAAAAAAAAAASSGESADADGATTLPAPAVPISTTPAKDFFRDALSPNAASPAAGSSAQTSGESSEGRRNSGDASGSASSLRLTLVLRPAGEDAEAVQSPRPVVSEEQPTPSGQPEDVSPLEAALAAAAQISTRADLKLGSATRPMPAGPLARPQKRQRTETLLPFKLTVGGGASPSV